MAPRPTPSPSPSPAPTAPTKDLESGDYSGFMWELGDFLFAAKSIAKIANGKGSWGDAAMVGVSAASLFFPPLKLGKLATPALKAVAIESEKMLQTEVVSIVGRRQLEKNIKNTRTLLNHSEESRPRIAQELEDGTFEITKVPALAKNLEGKPLLGESSDVADVSKLEDWQQVRAQNKLDEIKKSGKEYDPDTNVGEITKAESKNPYDLEDQLNPEEALARKKEFRQENKRPKQQVKVSTVPRSQAAVDRFLENPSRAGLKKVYDNLVDEDNIRLLDDPTASSALGPEIIDLQTDASILFELGLKEVVDKLPVSKVIAALETLVKKETDKKFRTRIGETIQDLKDKGVKSDFFQTMDMLHTSKLNRVDALKAMLAEKESSAFIRQTTDTIPFRKKSGTVDYKAPRSYDQPATIKEAESLRNVPAAPARAVPAETRADIVQSLKAMSSAKSQEEFDIAVRGLKAAEKDEALNIIRATRESWAKELIRTDRKAVGTLKLAELETEKDRLSILLKTISELPETPFRSGIVNDLRGQTRARLKKIVARLESTKTRESVPNTVTKESFGKVKYSTPTRQSRKEAVAIARQKRLGKPTTKSKPEVKPASKRLTSSKIKTPDFITNKNVTIKELQSNLDSAIAEWKALNAKNYTRNGRAWVQQQKDLADIERKGRLIRSRINKIKNQGRLNRTTRRLDRAQTNNLRNNYS